MLLLALYRFLGAASHALRLLVGDPLGLLLRKAPAPCAIRRLSASSNSGLSRSRLCQRLRSERSCGNTNEFQAAEAETFRSFVGPFRSKSIFASAKSER